MHVKDHESNAMRYCAAIVLFEPESELYLDSIQSIIDANVVPIVFDNSEGEERRRQIRRKLQERHGKCEFFYLSAEGNVGLAAAYNKCIERAELLGNFEGIFLLDQDSTVPSQSLLNLLTSYERISRHLAVGVIAGMAMRQDFIPYRVYKQRPTNAYLGSLLPVRIAPSSFSLIPFSALRTVGRFYDDFFIDHIDVDFCFRCRNAGLLVAIDPESPFPHKIGHGLVSVLGYAISPISSPFRHYYQARNIVLSARRRGASLVDMVMELIKRFVVIGVVGVASGQLLKRYRFAFLGMWDGFWNRGGRISIGRS